MRNAKRIFRLLIVEDDQSRIDCFHLWLDKDVRIVVASSAGRALGILERDGGNVYAGILLDHDLEKQAATDKDLDITGSHLVTAIIRNIDKDVQILVHSMNPGKAQTMAEKLSKAGFRVTRIPMRDLTRMRLRAWVEDVREEWEEFAT